MRKWFLLILCLGTLIGCSVSAPRIRGAQTDILYIDPKAQAIIVGEYWDGEQIDELAKGFEVLRVRTKKSIFYNWESYIPTKKYKIKEARVNYRDDYWIYFSVVFGRLNYINVEPINKLLKLETC